MIFLQGFKQSGLFWCIHAPLFLTCLICAILNFRRNGLRDPQWHRLRGRTILCVWLFVLFTGYYLERYF
jgi:uncharacterized membrane protein YozB (DUF420 family)